MNALWIMIPISVMLGSFFLMLFILASNRKQYEDLETPAMRMLLESKIVKQENIKKDVKSERKKL